MSGSMYMVRGEELIEMAEQPYGLESHLQKWIAQHPPLLAGNQMNAENPRRWILIGAELAIPSELDGSGRWPIDHLFIDQDAIPTIVETKRSSNPEIRRQVVGQMIDYAANAVRYLPISSIRSYFQATCMKDKCEPSEKLTGLLGPDADVEQFWELAESNLQTGRIRLVFVGDIIPPELRRAVEYLNDQMRDAEVLAVEVKQFKGEGVTTLVPRVIGQTERAQQKKTVAKSTATGAQWEKDSFFTELALHVGPAELTVARNLLEWAEPLNVVYGKGRVDGSCVPIFDFGGGLHYTFSMWTLGRIEIQFEYMMVQPPFDELSLRQELARQLNEIDRMPVITDTQLTRRPTLPFSLLTNEASLSAFKNAFDWYLATVRASIPQ